MHIHTILFDLDDTLYPSSTGLWNAIRTRMEKYMLEVLNFPAGEISQLRKQLFLEYGTTLRGLQAVYQVDTENYLAYVHDLPLHNYLQPDPALRQILLSLPQRRVIFTNADHNHARRVLNVLGLSDCFEQIIDILKVAPYCKPQSEAFDIALQSIGVNQPAGCLLIDDAPHNLTGARNFGLRTLRAGSSLPSPDYDGAIETLVDLPAALQIFESESVTP